MSPPVYLNEQQCKICMELDYYMFDVEFYIKKSKMKVRKPFPLSKVPKNLFDVILAKMNYTSFQRFRRTNKSYFEYIDENRENIEIALFHDKSIILEMKHKNENDNDRVPCVKFCHTSFWAKCPTSREEIDNLKHDEIRHIDKQNQLNLNPIQKTWARYGNKRKFVVVRKTVMLYLDEVEKEPNIRRELRGVYKPVSVEASHFENHDWNSCSSLFISFLSFTNISGVSLKSHGLESTALLQICNLIRPTELDFNLKTPLRTFVYNDCFKNIRTLSFDMAEFDTNSLNSFEVMRSSSTVEAWYFQIILRRWIRGEFATEEMNLNVTNGIAVLDQLCQEDLAKPLSLEEAWPYMKSHYKSFKKFKRSSLMIYHLEQQTSEKKAICTTDTGTDSNYVEFRRI